MKRTTSRPALLALPRLSLRSPRSTSGASRVLRSRIVWVSSIPWSASCAWIRMPFTSAGKNLFAVAFLLLHPTAFSQTHAHLTPLKQNEGLRVQVPQLQVRAELGFLRVLRTHAYVALRTLQPQYPQSHPTVCFAVFLFNLKITCRCLTIDSRALNAFP